MSSSPERMVVPAGRILYLAGDEAHCAYVILAGVVELRHAAPDRSDTQVLRRAGEIFGDLALVDDSRRSCEARTVSDCELLVFTPHHLSDRVRDTDPLLRVVIGSIMARYGDMQHRLCPGERAEEPVRPAPLWQAHSAAARELISFEHQLRRGLQGGEFEIYFQPIVNLVTGDLAGFETLTRWNHPERGLAMPARFIPLAESTGVITEVTRFCLREVGRLLPALQAQGAKNPLGVTRLFATVNVSGLDLAQSAFASMATTILCDAGVDPEDVKLEITESTVMVDTERCAQTLANCRDQGFEIAIDDFGTGYSSLHYLDALPVSVLKIDQSFSRALLRDAGGHKIMGAIVRLGAELGLRLVAEGVETLPQCELLQHMGCDFGQGYLFGAPVPFKEALALVRNWVPVRDAAPQPLARPAA